MKQAIKTVCFTLFSMGFFSVHVFSADKSGTTALPFLTMGVGARSLAMAEAATASTNDATALYWNPAGLLGVEGQAASFMHSSGDTSSYDYAAYARHRGPRAWGGRHSIFFSGLGG